MLRLYKSTIIVSGGFALVTLAAGIICEFVYIPHGVFVQNLSVGLFCSLLVVIITSVLQYGHAKTEKLVACGAALDHLISELDFVNSGISSNLPEDFYVKQFEDIDRALKHALFCSQDFAWFSKKKRTQEADVRASIEFMQFDFEGDSFSSKKDSVLALVQHKEFIHLIDAAIAFLEGTFYCDVLKWKKRKL